MPFPHADGSPSWEGAGTGPPTSSVVPTVLTLRFEQRQTPLMSFSQQQRATPSLRTATGPSARRCQPVSHGPARVLPRGVLSQPRRGRADVNAAVSPEGKGGACKLLDVFLCFVRRYKSLARRAGLLEVLLAGGQGLGTRAVGLQCSPRPGEGAPAQAALAGRPAAPPSGCN